MRGKDHDGFDSMPFSCSLHSTKQVVGEKNVIEHPVGASSQFLRENQLVVRWLTAIYSGRVGGGGVRQRGCY